MYPQIPLLPQNTSTYNYKTISQEMLRKQVYRQKLYYHNPTIDINTAPLKDKRAIQLHAGEHPIQSLSQVLPTPNRE